MAMVDKRSTVRCTVPFIVNQPENPSRDERHDQDSRDRMGDGRQLNLFSLFKKVTINIQNYKRIVELKLWLTILKLYEC